MDNLTHILGIVALAGASVVALASLVIGIPGTFIIVAIALLYALATGFVSVTWTTLASLLAMAVAGEALEFISAVATTSGPRPSRRVNLAAIAGGMIGGVLGLPLLFGLGSLLGALGGAFAGAALAAGSQGHGFTSTLRYGVAAVRGRLLGFVAKVAIGVCMLALLLSAAL